MRAFALLPIAFLLAACDKHDETATYKPAPPARSASASAVVSAAPATPQPLASKVHPALLDPSKAGERAPEVFSARFTTSGGDFVIEAHRDWAPLGADRFYNLVKMGFFDDLRFFRTVSGFMVQFGISGDPAVSARWTKATLVDDPVKESNMPGFVSFAQTNAPNSRATQIFINLGDNHTLDAAKFAPFGKVIKGMAVVEALYAGYGEAEPQGLGPNPFIIQGRGNEYLDAMFPRLATLIHAEVVPSP